MTGKIERSRPPLAPVAQAFPRPDRMRIARALVIIAGLGLLFQEVHAFRDKQDCREQADCFGGRLTNYGNGLGAYQEWICEGECEIHSQLHEGVCDYIQHALNSAQLIWEQLQLSPTEITHLRNDFSQLLHRQAFYGIRNITYSHIGWQGDVNWADHFGDDPMSLCSGGSTLKPSFAVIAGAGVAGQVLGGGRRVIRVLQANLTLLQLLAAAGIFYYAIPGVQGCEDNSKITDEQCTSIKATQNALFDQIFPMVCELGEQAVSSFQNLTQAALPERNLADYLTGFSEATQLLGTQLLDDAARAPEYGSIEIRPGHGTLADRDYCYRSDGMQLAPSWMNLVVPTATAAYVAVKQLFRTGN